MSDSINILQRAENVEIAPLFNTYSKVILNIDDETQASSGSGSGRTLELDNPLFGSQAVAAKMLQRLRGYQYQPYSAQGALVDPAAEMGDAISVHDVYGGIYTRERNFSRLMITDVSAPNDEEINHEYKYETPTERKLKREMEDVRATFAIQSDRIEARVAKIGGNNNSFGWVLTDSGHTWYSGSKQVMKVSSSGLEITGKITATSGYIGNGSQGFEISSRSLFNGMTSLNDTTHNGVYVGVDGISLGRGNFKVDASGNLTARRGTFGSLSVDSGGTSSYSGRLSGCGGSVSSGLSYGGGSYGSLSSLDNGLRNVAVKVDSLEANAITTNNLVAKIANAGTVRISTLILNGNQLVLNTEAWWDRDGNWHRIYYWGI